MRSHLFKDRYQTGEVDTYQLFHDYADTTGIKTYNSAANWMNNVDVLVKTEVKS